MIAPAWAAPSFNPNQELNKNRCESAVVGKTIVDVHQTVIADVESGPTGNWAGLSFGRHIQVWQQENGDFCAVVNYDGGRFDAVAGPMSPGGTARLDGSEVGSFDGGYRATISGTLEPIWNTHGNIGTFDYGCGTALRVDDCPGYVSWTSSYFGKAYSFTYEFWSYTYKATNGHTFTSSIFGNAGDIK